MHEDQGRLRRSASLAAVFLLLIFCGAWLRPADDGGPRRLSALAGGRDEACLPDFAAITDVRARKLEFFAYLLPLVARENERLAGQRRRLEGIRDRLWYDGRLTAEDYRWLVTMAADYRVAFDDPEAATFWQRILRRVDAVPERLVLIQAAVESAWGTSRFAREGNNLFGQWCFRPGCGLVPSERAEEATHEVATFATVRAAVAAYLWNLNTGATYTGLREIRSRLRARGQYPRADALAVGLAGYSERRQDYVADLMLMIRQNDVLIDEAQRRLRKEAI